MFRLPQSRGNRDEIGLLDPLLYAVPVKHPAQPASDHQRIAAPERTDNRGVAAGVVSLGRGQAHPGQRRRR